MNKQVSKSISVMRVIGMLYVAIICHYLGLYISNPKMLNLLAQMFSFAGVSIFFAISGFLFGFKDNNKKFDIKENLSWLKNRVIRILISYEIVLITVVIVRLVTKNEVSWLNFGSQVLNLQGIFQLKYAFSELGHTWFLSILVVCYLITPILRMVTSKKCRYAILSVFVLVIIALSFLPTVTCASYTSSILVYVVMYFYGKEMANFSGVNNPVKYILALFGALLIRLITWYFFDDTTVYNIVLCLLAVFTVFSYFHISIWFWGLIQKTKLWKVLDKAVINLDKISYEFYLVHAIIISGSTALLFDGGYIEMVLLLILSYILAVMLNFLSGIIIKKLKGKN